jgi:hypothetical protein
VQQTRGKAADLQVLAGRWEESERPALGKLLAALAENRQPVLVVGPPAAWVQFEPRLLALSHERGRGIELLEALRLAAVRDLD